MSVLIEEQLTKMAKKNQNQIKHKKYKKFEIQTKEQIYNKWLHDHFFVLKIILCYLNQD